MKKRIAILCSAIALALGLSVAPASMISAEELNSTAVEYQQAKIADASDYVVTYILPMMENIVSSQASIDKLNSYSAKELEFMFSEGNNMYIEGYALKSAISSFASGMETIGEIIGYGSVDVTVDGDELIVDVEVFGTNKDGVAEVIVSNDLFLTLKSAALNPSSTMGELMGKAGMNTLLGMGTVFSVLVIIIGVISLFNLIPYFQKKMENKKKNGVDNAVAQIEKQEEQVVNEADDTELVAVIAAAIAAFEGSTSTDGFVVRSIIRR